MCNKSFFNLINDQEIDDYNNERKEIRRKKGSKYRFSYGDYVVKSLIGSIDVELDKSDEKSKDGCILNQKEF